MGGLPGLRWAAIKLARCAGPCKREGPEPARADGRGERDILDTPNPADSPQDCMLCGRCPLVEPRCVEEEPPMSYVSGGGLARCHLVHGDAGPPPTR